MKVTNAQQHVNIFYTFSNCARYAESTSKFHLDLQAKHEYHYVSFHRTAACLTTFCKELLNQVSRNLSNGLVTDTRS